MNLKAKIDYSINLIRKAEKLSLQYSKEGFHLAFSGGKDSQVIYHLAKMADVKFTAHMNLTSVDPPQVLKFIRKYYPDVILHHPQKTIFQLVEEKKCLPTRIRRWCCRVLKEESGAGKVAILGIRREESAKRAKRNELELSEYKFSGTLDQFSERQETEITCISGKDKIMLSPILNWTTKEVWEYLKLHRLPYCELYNLGYHRIGCILCPMATQKNNQRDRKLFPQVEKAYKKAIQRLMENNPNYMSALGENRNPGVIFEHWVSCKNIKSFIADEYQQLKLDFES